MKLTHLLLSFVIVSLFSNQVFAQSGDKALVQQHKEALSEARLLLSQGSILESVDAMYRSLDIADRFENIDLAQNFRSASLRWLAFGNGALGNFDAFDKARRGIIKIHEARDSTDSIVKRLQKRFDVNQAFHERIKAKPKSLDAVKHAYLNILKIEMKIATSLPDLNQSLENLVTACGPDSETEARLCFQIAKFHRGVKQFPAAIEHYSRSKRIRTKLFGNHDADIVVLNYEIGTSYWSSGNLVQAEKFLRSAVDNAPTELELVLSKFGFFQLIAGRISQRNGHSDASVAYHRSALNTYKKQGRANSIESARVSTSLSAVMSYLENHEMSNEYARQAHDSIDGLKNDPKKMLAYDPLFIEARLADAKESLGISFKNLGQYERAMVLLAEYQKTALKLKLGQDVGYAHSLKHTAECLLKLGRLKEARDAIFEATQYYRERRTETAAGIGDHLPSFESLAGEILNANGQFSDAITQLESASKHQRILNSTDAIVDADICNALAVAYAGQGKRRATRDSILKAIDFLWAHHNQQPHLLSASEMVNFNIKLRSTLAFLSHAIDRQDPTQVTELYKQVWRAKGSVARTLREQNDILKSASRKPGKSHLLETHRQSTSRLSNSILQYLVGDNSLRESVLAKGGDVQRLMESIIENVPNSRESKFQSMNDLTRVLGTKRALVDIFKTEKTESYPATYIAFVVTSVDNKLNIESVDLGRSAALDERILEFVSQFDVELARGLTKKKTTIRRKGSSGKYIATNVWSKIEKLLGGRDQIIVCPSGQFVSLPWAALPKEQGGYLVEDFLFVTQSDAQSILRFTKSPSVEPLNVLLIGGLDYGEAPGFATENGNRAKPRHQNWENLTNTIEEIKSIRNAIPKSTGQIVIDEIDEKEFAERMAEFNCIHIASHGFFSNQLIRENDIAAQQKLATLERFPFASQGIVLTNANETFGNQTGENAWLTGMELMRTDLGHIELVVLSACHSAGGQLEPSEGVFGLQKAFHLAGAQSSIASRWAVDDKQTSELIPLFYKNYFKNRQLGKAEALRQAQLTFVKRGAQPADWASWTLIGDWR